MCLLIRPCGPGRNERFYVYVLARMQVHAEASGHLEVFVCLLKQSLVGLKLTKEAGCLSQPLRPTPR